MLDDAGKLTGPTSATPSDEAAKALLSFGNPATAIDPERRLRVVWTATESRGAVQS
jgi:hypothetical protein